jgi:hypothetical protein
MMESPVIEKAKRVNFRSQQEIFEERNKQRQKKLDEYKNKMRQLTNVEERRKAAK